MNQIDSKKIISHSHTDLDLFQSLGLTINEAVTYTETGVIRHYLDEQEQCVPGVYRNLPAEDYHQAPAYSHSQLKVLINQSAKHFYCQFIESDKTTNNQKPASYLTTGEFIHALCLEPDKVYQRYYCDLAIEDYPTALKTITDIDQALVRLKQPKTKVGEKKANKIARLLSVDPDIVIWDQLLLNHHELPEHQHKTPIAKTTWLQAYQAIKAIYERSEAKEVLSAGISELSLFTICPITQLLLKCRIDWLTPTLHLWDLKTADTANPVIWKSKAAKYGYQYQDAFYRYVFEMCTGLLPNGFDFLVIEYQDVSICELITLSQETKQMADDIVVQALIKLKNCLEENHWPGYTTTGTALVDLTH
ncbi:PD-(D/E)XK nuclease-like domain-containing protein [Spartinivicinus poritis]|uniref:PD-(D/E)XK nuclease-like domain-containing protein n=1 Tax=Spartinivicinus poritis TaxID=2994640 RepID=A0ABT5UHU7_9GAMM|nr:PD-(D/E)XK nuclease-like domain-containing protein [Spartinivicinus sp. A2-2]MDE1465971.1 PD-(D/E)XK nuclease-like domain-containing protein [Spartinivicinus sp. A2-2]